MPDMFSDVLDFHRKLAPHLIGTEGPKFPAPDVAELRTSLILEEFEELGLAWDEADLAATADAIGDLIYVLLGYAISAGIDMRHVWNRIHAANMAKEGGPTRPDGKILKPPGWRPPDIAGVLASQAPLSREAS